MSYDHRSTSWRRHETIGAMALLSLILAPPIGVTILAGSATYELMSASSEIVRWISALGAGAATLATGIKMIDKYVLD